MILAVSYNQPKFCPSATWNPNATTFENSSAVGFKPYGIFIDTNNTIYVTVRSKKLVSVWTNQSRNSTRNINLNSNNSHSIFVTITGDIYVDNGNRSGINKWTLNSNQSQVAMNIIGDCYGVFVDIRNNLYCCMGYSHQIVKILLNSSMNSTRIVAGNGSNGSASNMLYNPRGIFVDINLNLYVADCSNSRVQLFSSGQLNGTTIAGNTTADNFTFGCPHGVVLDADNRLFILDYTYHRIVRQGTSGFYCLVGCSGEGSESINLASPLALAFDSYGNIFVTDGNNSRIQKFLLSTNSCGKNGYALLYSLERT